MWYFPDLNYTNLANAPVNGGYRNHIFYSNAIRIHIDTNFGLGRFFAYTAADTVNFIEITARFNVYEWNHIIARVSYDNVSTYSMSLVTNNDISNLVNLGTTGTDMSFVGFYMCHEESSSCSSNNFYWASGLYKDLRFWDGDSSSYETIFTYNNYFDYKSNCDKV